MLAAVERLPPAAIPPRDSRRSMINITIARLTASQSIARRLERKASSCKKQMKEESMRSGGGW